jgi:hypothetical protein
VYAAYRRGGYRSVRAAAEAAGLVLPGALEAKSPG